MEKDIFDLTIPEEGQKFFDDPSLIAECDLDMVLEHLKYSKKLKAAKYSLDALESIHADSSSTFVKIKRKMEDLGATVTTAKSMFDFTYSDSTETRPLQKMVNKVIAECEAILWAVKNQDTNCIGYTKTAR